MIITRRKLLHGLGGVGALPLISRPSLAQSLSLRSPLAFPAGMAPGINPSHPAARGLIASAVPMSGGNALNLVTGKPFVAGGATTVQETLGSTVYNANFLDASITTPGIGAIPSAGTYAVIARVITIQPGAQVLIMYTDAIGNRGLVLAAGQVMAQGSGGGQTASGFTLVAGIPYFCAISDPYDTTKDVYFVVKNLATGQFQSSAVASLGDPARTDDTIEIGNSVGGTAASEARIAAAMYSPNLYLSLPQLRQWSDDPWSFWYPQQDLSMLVGLSGSAARLRSLIGVGQ